MEREIRDYSITSREASGAPPTRSQNARAWLRAFRPLAQGNLAPFILIGASEGATSGRAMGTVGVGLALLWGLMDHGVIVFANDLADEQSDGASHGATLLSGGSRVLVEGLLRREDLARGLILAAAGLVAVSAIGVARCPDRWAIFVFCTLSALALLYAYGNGPRLAYRGGGEWLQALGVGAVLPTVGAAFQSEHTFHLHFSSYAALVLFGLAGNFATSLPDAEDDAAVGKWSPAARLGVVPAFHMALALNAIAMVVAVSSGHQACLIGLPLLAFSVLQMRFLRASCTRMRAVYPLAISGGAMVAAWAIENLAKG